MRWTAAALMFLLLASTAEASCETHWDYCMNISLPYDYTGSGGTYNDPYFYLHFDSLEGLQNIENINYTYYNMSNVYASVTNSTGSGAALYDVPVVDTDSGAILKLRYDLKNSGTVCRSAACSSTNLTYSEVCLNGTYSNSLTREAGPIILNSALHKYITVSDFEAKYRRNWTFRYEENSSLVSFTGNNATLKVWCNDYSEFELNLTDLVGGGGSLTVQTKQKPKYFLTLNSLSDRIRQDEINFLLDEYYILSSSDNADQYTLTLRDRTGGQFYKSTVSVQSVINDSFGNIHVEQFEQDNVMFPFLLNRTQYKMIVTSQDGVVRDLGPFYVQDNNLERDVEITLPELGGLTSAWEGLTIDVTQDWGGSQLGCNVNSTISTSGYFEVFNVSADGVEILEYSTSSSGTNLAFIKTVDDNNGTYKVHCAANDTTYGVREMVEYINMRNTTAIYEGFDLELPETVVGLSRDFTYKLLSLIIIIILFSLFNQQNYGTGALVTGMMVILFDFIGWLPLPNFFTALLLFMAVFVKLSERRKGVAT